MSGGRALLKFALFAVVCLAAAAWLISTIGNISFADRTTYEAAFDDVLGLAVNDSVKISGVDVGKVTGIDVERGKAVVSFSADDDLEIGEDSQIAIRWRNALGLRYVYIVPGGGDPIEAGHRFENAQTREPADLGTLLARLTPVMRALNPEVGNIVVRELSQAIGGHEQEIRTLVDDAGELLATLADRDDAIDRTLTNGAELLEAYASRTEDIERLISSFANVSETVASRNDVLIRAIDELTDVSSELERLLDENDPDLRRLIKELDEAAAILSVNRDNLEGIVTYTGRGIVNYHLISRDGQWFNIRVPGVSFGEETLATERSATLPPRGDRGDTLNGSSRSASWTRVFGSLGGGR